MKKPRKKISLHAEINTAVQNKRLVMTVYFLLRLSVILVMIARCSTAILKMCSSAC